MTGKSTKTTQNPNDPTALCHKSPTAAETTQKAPKPAPTTPARLLPVMIDQHQRVQADEDKEMTDDASTAMCQATNMSTADKSKQKPSAKQPNTTRMICNPWKTITAWKQGNMTTQTEQGGTTTREPPTKSRCQIKWWNQASGKGAKTAHRQKILNIMENFNKADPMTMLYRFYSTDKNAPTWIYPPSKKEQLNYHWTPQG